MIVVIRISGMIEIPQNVAGTLDRLRLRKKFCCVLLNETPEFLGMINNVRNFVAYGRINRETLVELIKKRGKSTTGKIDAEKTADELLNSKIPKRLSDFNLKPFFSMHPPRGGINSKLHFPKGVLGDNKEKINELIMRML